MTDVLEFDVEEELVIIEPEEAVLDLTGKVFARRTEADYKQYNQREQIYNKPNTYIGDIMRNARTVWAYNEAKVCMEEITTDLPKGLEKILLELISNACDNKTESDKRQVPFHRLEMSIEDNKYINITNDGERIVVGKSMSKHTGVVTWIPQMTFGELNTSTNYEGERHGGGTNGFGSKLTNIFSKMMEVLVCDSVSKLQYYQQWRENMTICDEPVITPYEGAENLVSVRYLADFKYFGYDPEVGYPPEMTALFHQHAISTSMNTEIPIRFNGVVYDYSVFRKYCKLYFGADAVKSAVEWYQYGNKTSVKSGNDKRDVDGKGARVKLMVLDTPGQSRVISFANALMTTNGGKHVKAAAEAVTQPIVDRINSGLLKKLGIGKKKTAEPKVKGKKGKKTSAEVKKKEPETFNYTVQTSDVMSQVSMILSVRVPDPHFDAQTKTILEHPNVPIYVDPDVMDIVERWRLVKYLGELIMFREHQVLTASIKGEGGHHNINAKYVPANRVANRCTDGTEIFMPSEGDSGNEYAEGMVAYLKASDYISTFPLKGKPANVRKHDKFVLKHNEELANIVSILELDLDMDYRIPENFATLSHRGGIMIMADADCDGSHIKGLLINFLHHYWPSLLAINYISSWETPIMCAQRGIKSENNKTKVWFFTDQEYLDWAAGINPDDIDPTGKNRKKWIIRYFKGLGSSTNKEISEHLKMPKQVIYYYDDQCDTSMNIAFGPNKLNVAERKKILTGINPEAKDFIIKTMPISKITNGRYQQTVSNFVYTGLLEFMHVTLTRAIPSLTDFLKESQRKIIYAAINLWHVKHSGTHSYELFGVQRFANEAAASTMYHHAPDILEDVIINMARNFGGSINNVNVFEPKGQFGSIMSGRAAKSRYLKTRPMPYFHLIYRPEDEIILEYLKDEGRPIEPRFYYPIIPTGIVNGVTGIAVGFSCDIKCYNPIQVINNMLLVLQGVSFEELEVMFPWFRFWGGTIQIITRPAKGGGRRKKVQIEEGKVQVTTIVEGQVTSDVIEDDVGQDIVKSVQDKLKVEVEIEDKVVSKPLKSMKCYGKYTIDAKKVITVHCLPLGVWGKTYTKWLKSLIKEGKLKNFNLQKYTDKYDNKCCKYTLFGFAGEVNHENLGLVKSQGMSNIYLLNDANVPQKFHDVLEVLEEFMVIRYAAYARRKEVMLAQLAAKIQLAQHRLAFVEAVVNKRITVIGNTTAEVWAQMVKCGIPTDVYKTVAVSSLDKNGVVRMQEAIVKMQEDYASLMELTVESMWSAELIELRTALLSRKLTAESYMENMGNSGTNPVEVVEVKKPTRRKAADKETKTPKGAKVPKMVVPKKIVAPKKAAVAAAAEEVLDLFE